MYLLGYGLPEESCSKDVPEHLVQLNKLYRPAVLRRVVLQVKRSTHLINFVHKLLDELFFRKSIFQTYHFIRPRGINFRSFQMHFSAIISFFFFRDQLNISTFTNVNLLCGTVDNIY